MNTIAPKASWVEHGRSPAATALAALALLILAVPVARGAGAEGKRRVIPLTISKGETYVIDHVKRGTEPRVRDQINPHAVVVRTDVPGKIVLVGADNGSWKFDVTLANGERVTYAVNVKAVAPSQGSLEPGTAPTAIR